MGSPIRSWCRLPHEYGRPDAIQRTGSSTKRCGTRVIGNYGDDGDAAPPEVVQSNIQPVYPILCGVQGSDLGRLRGDRRMWGMTEGAPPGKTIEVRGQGESMRRLPPAGTGMLIAALWSIADAW